LGNRDCVVTLEKEHHAEVAARVDVVWIEGNDCSQLGRGEIG
jgi:hypothetical protein